MKHAIIQSMTYKTVHSRRHEPHSIRRSGLMWAESVDMIPDAGVDQTGQGKPADARICFSRSEATEYVPWPHAY